MTTQDVIQQMIRDRVVGRKIDLVNFMDQFLILVYSAGEIHCVPADDDHLRFTVANEPAFEVALDHASGKLRTMCARLAVLSQGAGQPNVYGGSGWITLPSVGSANGAGGAEVGDKKLHVEFNNKPGDAWFSIRSNIDAAGRVHESEKQHA